MRVVLVSCPRVARKKKVFEDTWARHEGLQVDDGRGMKRWGKIVSHVLLYNSGIKKQKTNQHTHVKKKTEKTSLTANHRHVILPAGYSRWIVQVELCKKNNKINHFYLLLSPAFIRRDNNRKVPLFFTTFGHLFSGSCVRTIFFSTL